MSDRVASEEAARSPCQGELVNPRRSFFGAVNWTIYDCSACGAKIATANGRRHWWNFEMAREAVAS